ncbi:MULTISPECIES: ubiquinone anaerobic biosynthesis accessory factor UbiT [Xanthobacter]|jgi:predicted lipid carrier protein YhbT|uniref:ubiquinone anaerobic biosynthesis accessory factor UbiT n=1 Tax=Xanthobacter TaxID=279 RepID=UPI00372C9C92
MDALLLHDRHRVSRLISMPLRLLPLGLILTRALRALSRSRPEVFERLGPHARNRFIVTPDELGVSFAVRPEGSRAQVQVVRRGTPGDVEISGPLLDLIGIVDGQADGDALFFQGRLKITGSTEATLALRNAIESADLEPADLLGIPEPLAGAANRSLRAAIATLRSLENLPDVREARR